MISVGEHSLNGRKSTRENFLFTAENSLNGRKSCQQEKKRKTHLNSFRHFLLVGLIFLKLLEK